MRNVSPLAGNLQNAKPAPVLDFSFMPMIKHEMEGLMLSIYAC